MNNTGKFLTSRQVADKLGFTAEYIRRLCADGTLKAEKFGKTWIISITELKKLKRQRFPREKEDADGSQK